MSNRKKKIQESIKFFETGRFIDSFSIQDDQIDVQNNTEFFCNCLCHTDGMSFCVGCNKFHKKKRFEKSVIIRDLQESDFDNGFFETLGEFRNISGLEYLKAPEILKDINKNKFHKIMVAVRGNMVIGCMTVIIERKFIHNGGNVAHVEDLVVRNEERGQYIAHHLITNVIKFAKDNHAYKILLNCRDELIPLWKKYGFETGENVMRYNVMR